MTKNLGISVQSVLSDSKCFPIFEELNLKCGMLVHLVFCLFLGWVSIFWPSENGTLFVKLAAVIT